MNEIHAKISLVNTTIKGLQPSPQGSMGARNLAMIGVAAVIIVIAILLRRR